MAGLRDQGILQVNDISAGGGGGGDGAITDGVSASIKATVLDLVNSNPLAVSVRDANGDLASLGGGTEYTEDAPAAADPIGKVNILVRVDTPAAITSANGDNVAQRGTNFGAGYVTLLDTAGNPVSVGGGTQYTEDAPAAADPIGTGLNLVRADALAAVTSADGDNVAARGTNKGEQYVKHVDSIAVTGTFWQATQPVSGPLTDAQLRAATVPISGTVTANLGTIDGASTLAEQQTQTTALQLIDDTVHAANAALGKAIAIGGQLDDTVTTAATENNVSTARITPQRAIHVNLRDQAGAEVSVGGGTQYTEDAPAAADPVGTALNLVRLDTLAAITSADGDNVAARGTNKGELYVKHVDSIPVTGTFWQATQPVSGTVTATGPLTDAELRATAVPVSITGVSTLAEQQTQTTALQLIDDAIHAQNGAFSKAIAIGGMLDDTAPAAATENNVSAIRITAARGIHVNLRDVAGAEIAPLTDTQLRATAVPVSEANKTTTDTIDTGAGDSVGLAVPATGTARIWVSGTWTGTLLIQGSADGGATYDNVRAVLTNNGALLNAGSSLSNLVMYAVPCSGFTHIRVLGPTSSGTATINISAGGGGADAVHVLNTITVAQGNAGGSPWLANVSQINGVTPLMGNGVTGTGSQRVTIASDNTAFTVNVGTFPDNEPFNVSQINGVAPLMGAGNTGTGSQRVTIASDQAAIATTPAGNVAHDAVDSGNPLKIGGQAQLDEPTAVVNGDRVNAWFDLHGRLVILSGHGDPEPPVTANGSAAGVSVIATPGASLSLHICKGSVHNSNAAPQIVSLRDGAAGTIRWTAELGADGGGSVLDFGSRGWKLTANTALVMDAAAATAYCNITEYYIAP